MRPNENTNVKPTRILRLSEVMRRTGISRSAVYLNMKKKAFPEQIVLGPRSVGWLESEVDEWINKRIVVRSADIYQQSE